MSSVAAISTVTPLYTPKPQTNNFIAKSFNVIQQIKYLIIAEAFLGINRIYLLQVSKLRTVLCNIYCIILMCLNVYSTFYETKVGTSYIIVKNTLIIENIILVIFVITCAKKKLVQFFQNITAFDEMLNIQNAVNITSSGRLNFGAVAICIIYGLCEFYLEINIFYEDNMSFCHLYMLIVSLTHEIEQIFFLTLLRFTYLRILIVKAHTMKVFNVADKIPKKINKFEALSNKATLDISSLHRAYELLHTCSLQLNAVMSVPMLLIFFTSGISTIMLLKLFVNIFEISSESYKTKPTIIYLILRCIKHTLLLVIPCYYSSVTNTQASVIRTALHDAVNTRPIGKADHRKVKTFFHLTRESDFSYALCGVIQLNMSLPLSYMSLCTTYLVIIIQFSKFID